MAKNNYVTVERLHTKIPSLQGTSSASPWTASLSTPPAFLAIFRRLKLLSSPIVQRLELRFEGRERYFPLPQPESRPMEPVGMDSKNSAITGHGCQMVKPICCGPLKLSSDFVARSRKVVCDGIVDLVYMTLLIFERVICSWCKLQRVFVGHEYCGRGQVGRKPCRGRDMLFCHLDPVAFGRSCFSSYKRSWFLKHTPASKMSNKYSMMPRQVRRHSTVYPRNVSILPGRYRP